jgi:hypothetical protein
VKLAPICCIFLVMATVSARATDDSIEKLAQDSRCARALDWIDKNSDWVTQQQIRLTEIPAPEYGEGPRGEFLKKLFEASGLKVQTDKLGDVVATRPGSDAKSVVLLVAHLDTVFPAGTDVNVKIKGTRRAGRAGTSARGIAHPHNEDDRDCGRRRRRRRRESARRPRVGGSVWCAPVRGDRS